MSESAAAAPEFQPAWPTAPARRRWYDRQIDLKLLIAVLIGLVSVTGAVVTWRSSQLGEQATDKDRQAIAETVRLEQDKARNELTIQDARARVAAHAAAVVEAQLLRQQADRFAGTGDEETAADLRDEAEELETIAGRHLFGGMAALTAYVVDDGSGRPTLDEGRLRTDLREGAARESRVDPTQTVRDANRLRSESQHYDGWVVPLVCAVFLLTLAQVIGIRVLRLGLTGAAVVVWIVSTVLAFAGGS